MDFREICNILGGCVSSDNLRSDLAAVQRAITKHEQNSDPGYPSEQQAAQCLISACFNIARSDFNQAFNDLQTIENLGDTVSTRWHIRRRAYKLFAVGQQRHLPLLRFRPDAFEDSGTIADAEFNVRHVKLQMRQLRTELEQDSSNAYAAIDAVELECLQAIHLDFAERFALQAYLHQEYPDNIPKKQKYILMAQLMAKTDAVPAALLAKATSYRLEPMGRQLRRLNVDAKLTRGAHDAYDELSQLMRDCTTSQDELELASTYVMHGDHLSSPPTMHPLSLNLVTEGTLTGYEIDFWDDSQSEESHGLHRVEEATISYDDALSLFKKNDCARGQGAVHLRYACILHMESLQAARRGEADPAEVKREQAREHIAQAERLFVLDLAYLQLTKAHKLLLDISAGDRLQAIGEAKDIGTTCKDSRNTQLSRFLEILMLRFGRWQWRNRGIPGNALLCFQCAQVCSEASADPVYKYQATIAIAKLLCEQGSIPAAQAAYDSASQTLEAAKTILTRLGSTVPDKADGLSGAQNNLFGYLARVQNAIRRRAPNPAQMKTLMPELGSNFSLEQQENARKALRVLTHLTTEYGHALAEARSALAAADYEGYVTRLQRFLKHLSTSYSSAERSVNGYRIMTLCLLGQYQEASTRLSEALPPDLGGTGQDHFFSSAIFATVATSFGDMDLSLKPSHDQRVIEHSLGLCVWAKDWLRAAEILSVVQERKVAYLQRLANELQTGNWQAQAEVGAIYEYNDGLDEALKWYSLAARTLERHRTQTMDVEGRLSSMSSMNSAELFAGMIRVSLRMHRATRLKLCSSTPAVFKLKGNDWNAQALIFAEQSRARLLVDMLTLSENDTTRDAFRAWRKQSYVYRQYEDLTYNRGPAGVDDRDAKVSAVELRELYAQIPEQRDRDGLESRWSAAYGLLVETEFQCDLSTAFAPVGPDTLVLHYNVCIDSTIIFAVSNKGILRVRDVQLTATMLRQQALAYQKMVQKSDATCGLSNPQLAESIGALLAGFLLEPFQDLIDTRSKIVFVPSRELHAFPLCSLPFRGGPIFLQKCCSSIPCLTILSHLANRTRTDIQIKASIFVNEDKRLPIAAVSAAVAAKLYGSTLVATKQQTRDAFGALYEQSNLVYFVTHGHEAPAGASPWQANIMLDPRQDDPFDNVHKAQLVRVMDLANFHTNATLVIFGACLAAKGHTTLGNDVIGFSHAVLDSGAQCFIGALWSVSDWATALLMQLLHKTLHQNLGSISISECLQKAQIQFYHLTIDEAVTLLEEAVVDWERTAPVSAKESGWFTNCRYCALELIEDMQETDKVFNFKDPYYWAAWVVVGYGDARLGGSQMVDGPVEQTTKVTPAHGRDGPALAQRPAPTPLVHNPNISHSETLVLRQIHTVEHAGLPRYQPADRVSSLGAPLKVSGGHNRQVSSSSPPPPALPPRPSSRTPLPSPPPPDLQPRRASQPVASRFGSSINAPAMPISPLPSRNAPRRKPVNQSSRLGPPALPPAYSAQPMEAQNQHLQLQHRPRQQVDEKGLMQRKVAPQSSTPQVAPSVQRQVQVQRRPAQPQATRPSGKQPQPQQQRPTPVGSTANANRQRVPAGTDPRRAPRPVAKVPQAGPSVHPPGAATRPNNAGGPDQQPKLSKRVRMKKFAKTPVGRNVIRLGTGMLVGSVMAGVVADAAGMDWSNGGEDAGDLDGGGYIEEEYEVDAEETYYEGEEGMTFEDNILVSTEDGEMYGEEYYYEEDIVYEDTGAYEDAGAYEDTGAYEGVGVSSTGQDGGNELPGQIGPCFEDNVYVSAAMP